MDDENGGARTGNPDVTLRATQEEVRRNLTYCRDCYCDLGGGDCAVCHLCHLAPLAFRLLVAMREQALERIETHLDGTIWGRVQIADITVAGMAAGQKAGYCTALMRIGVYQTRSITDRRDDWWEYWGPYSGKVKF